MGAKAVAAAAYVAVVFAPNFASASTQVISGCANNASGAITGITTKSPKCSKSQTAVSWNVSGPPGPAGPAGAAGATGPAGATGAQGPAGPAGSGTLSANTNVQSINLVDASNKTLATLGTFSGEPGLAFFDGSGKLVLGVGLTSNAAGISVYDGNSIIGGTGIVRNAWGITNSGPTAGIGGFTVDAKGSVRTSWGDTIDDSYSEIIFFDANAGLRTGIQYIPEENFSGFFSQDGAGHSLSLVGNFLTTNASLFQQANESFLDLNDTSASTRLFEFQNSTNEGGIDFNPGSTAIQGSWGNP